MPTLTAQEASEYDSRITKLVPGYQLLHSTTAVQLQATLKDHAHILVVGAGTGKEVAELSALNSTWTFTAQDNSADMLAQAKQRFEELSISNKVTLFNGDISEIDTKADAALCLLVLHFVADNGDKKTLLSAIAKKLNSEGQLFLADLMRPETTFERDAQFLLCKQLGLGESAAEHMRHSFEHEFYTLDRIRFADLLHECGFSAAKLYFKALGFSGYVSKKR